MINVAQVSVNVIRVDYLNRNDSMSMSLVEDLITCFAHRDHMFETTSKMKFVFLQVNLYIVSLHH